MPTGLVFNIQKYSVNDGPGIRTTVFLKGCPLCCAWCHNPEGISPKPELLVVETRCAVCGECRAACPFGQSIPGTGALPVRNEKCILCHECVEACPTGARQLVGRELTVAEVMKEVLQDSVFYEESNGGVTVSGGEPLLQPAFVTALLEACRARNLHTAVDTCGFGCADDLLAMARLTDLILYDLKFMDDARHREHCGVPNRSILANLEALARMHSRIWIRVPVIPGVNDDKDNLAAIAEFAAKIGGVEQVNLLPYHKTGLSKHSRVGNTYELEELQPPSAEQMQTVARHFRTRGLKVKTGGS